MGRHKFKREFIEETEQPKPDAGWLSSNEYDWKMDWLCHVLIPLRMLWALYTPISDCDETYNYLEPIHYLLYGTGTRTWEYSPDYALRSYAYLWLFVGPAKFMMSLGIDKIALFTLLRVCIALLSCDIDQRLVKAVVKKWNNEVGCFLLAIMMFFSGSSHAVVSFLPQTFAMLCVTTSLAWWIEEEFMYAIFYMGVAGLVGWPFAVIMGIPMGIDILIRYKAQLWKPIAVVVGTIVACVVPSVLIDKHYYGKAVWAIGNIVSYNGAPASADGSQLYGTEPWTYYVKNLLLNFNGMLFVAFAPLGIFYIARTQNPDKDTMSYFHVSNVQPLLLYLSGGAIWLVIMFLMPHKEERFLYIVYPVMCLSAAYALAAARQHLDGGDEIAEDKEEKKFAILPYKERTKKVIMGLLTAFAVVSLSRSYSAVANYGAPFRTYSYLYKYGWRKTPVDLVEANVCVGKEWYRFPGHFFLPAHPFQDKQTVHRLEFLKSDFDGILPKQFDNEATQFTPPDMNDQNKEELSRYMDVKDCHWIVDLDLPDQKETPYYNYTLDHENYTLTFSRAYSAPFLDASASPMLTRAFYIPYISEWSNTYRRYILMRRNETKKGAYMKDRTKRRKKKGKGKGEAEKQEEKQEEKTAETKEEPEKKEL